MTDNRGHSAYLIWLIYHFRAVEKILPALKGKSKYGWAAPAALCLLVLVAMLGFGIYVDGYVVHPPAQYTGICQLPAQISSNGKNCDITVIQTVTSGTVVTTTHVTQTAGIVLYNQTGGH